MIDVDMSDDELNEFMALFREYRVAGALPPKDRKRFRELAAKWQKLKNSEDSREQPKTA